MPPEANDYEGAISYNQRFTHRQWNQLLLLAWDFTGGMFPKPGHLEGYRDRSNIVSIPSAGPLRRLGALD